MQEYSFLDYLETLQLFDDMKTYAEVFLRTHIEYYVDEKRFKNLKFSEEDLEDFGNEFVERFNQRLDYRLKKNKTQIEDDLIRRIEYKLLKEGMSADKISEITNLSPIHKFLLNL